MRQKVVDLGPDKLMLLLSLRGIEVKHCEMDLETSKSIHLGWGCGRKVRGGRLSLICWEACVSCQWVGAFFCGLQETVWVTGSSPRKAFLEGLICPLGVVCLEGGED